MGIGSDHNSLMTQNYYHWTDAK